ncbi:MAG: hypothetical protein KAS72_01535 [Phycisphaerales bacterium]|nr:hypothetical protein [Phycisphaerales bacterium]
MKRIRCHDRRGSALLVVVVLLAIGVVVVAAVVEGGAREQHIAVQRLATVRAFYAAEAGVNLAIREVTLSQDEDGDGGIGSISNDSDDNTDPTLGVARVAVALTTDVTDVVVTSEGRSSQARREIEVTLEFTIADPDPAPLFMAVFDEDDTTPGYSLWDGSSWSPAQDMPALPNTTQHIRLAKCPTRAEIAGLFQIHNYQAYFLWFDGTSWSSPTEVSSDISDGGEAGSQKRMRLCDVAYERMSGDGLIVYNECGSLKYQTFVGSALSGETTFLSTSDIASVELFSDPQSDRIFLLCVNDKDDLKVNIWSGTAWGGFTTLGTVDHSLYNSGNDKRPYCLMFEARSGDALVVYCDSTSRTKFQTYDGGWSGENIVGDIGGKGAWVRLARNPTNDTIVLAVADQSKDINVNIWNGSTWATDASGGMTEIETNLKDINYRPFDVAIEPGTNRALIVWGEKDQDALRYRTWSGSSWSSESLGTTVGNQAYQVRLSPGQSAGEMFILTRDGDEDTNAIIWDGSSMSIATELATDSHGSGEYHNIALATPHVALQMAHITLWTESEPGN